MRHCTDAACRRGYGSVPSLCEICTRTNRVPCRYVRGVSSTVRQFSFPTLRQWPLPLLLVSLGLTAVAAIDAHRAIRSQRDMADRAMREFASFAGWSYNERLENRLQAMLRESLGAVNHGNAVHETPPVPSARHLPHYLPFDSRCNCHRTYFGPNPIGMFAFELGDRGRDLDVMVNMDADPHFGWEEKAMRPVAR